MHIHITAFPQPAALLSNSLNAHIFPCVSSI